MSRIRNPEWKEDQLLKGKLEECVLQKYSRKEILVIVKKQFSQYGWSLRSLTDRLKHFDIRYIDYEVSLASVYRAVQEELDGPGSQLGYRAITQKVREVHKLKVPRDVVYNVMRDLDPDGLASRGDVGVSKKKKREKRFASQGPNSTMSLDGHDKLCGFQKATFPLCIYGGQDCYSGKIHFLKIWTTNNHPNVIGKFYYDHLYENLVLPTTVRIDRGSETDLLTTIHCLLHRKKETFETERKLMGVGVQYGPSTANKIERWWRELHHRMEKYFKEQLRSLLDNGDYDRTSISDRNILAFIYIPVIQKELDIFKETVWNHSRGRKQINKELPTGIPNFIYDNPEEFGAFECGTMISREDMMEVAEKCDIQDMNRFDFLDEDDLEFFSSFVDVDLIKPNDASEAYKYIKQRVAERQQHLESSLS